MFLCEKPTAGRWRDLFLASFIPAAAATQLLRQLASLTTVPQTNQLVTDNWSLKYELTTLPLSKQLL